VDSVARSRAGAVNRGRLCPIAGCGLPAVRAYRPYCSFIHQFTDPQGHIPKRSSFVGNKQRSDTKQKEKPDTHGNNV